MYCGVLSPQRGLPCLAAYAEKTAAIASPTRIPGRSLSGEVVRRHLPRGEPRQPAKVVEEARDVDGARVPVGELRDEERLVGDGDPGRAVEDNPQQRRARAAHAEDEQWRSGHGRRTMTRARSEWLPAVTTSM